MESIEQRALIELSHAQHRMRALNRRISDELNASLGAMIEKGEPTPLSSKNKWLEQAYSGTHTHDDGWVFTHHDNDVEGFLAEHCEHALRAHVLIKERAKERQSLGVAKRRVTLIANRLGLASLEKEINGDGTRAAAGAVTQSTATVYHGGGRRFLTPRAACNAQAKMLMIEHVERKNGFFDPVSDWNQRLIDRVARLLLRQFRLKLPTR